VNWFRTVSPAWFWPLSVYPESYGIWNARVNIDAGFLLPARRFLHFFDAQGQRFAPFLIDFAVE
jgi:hypothetical protein